MHRMKNKRQNGLPGSQCLKYMLKILSKDFEKQNKKYLHIQLHLIDLILCVTVNIFSVMLGRVFLGQSSVKQRLNCLARGHNAVLPARLQPTIPSSQVKHSLHDRYFFLISLSSADFFQN